MKTLTAAMVLLLVTTLAEHSAWARANGDAQAGEESRRIILHGVDCTIENGDICPEARAVFDEALAVLQDDDTLGATADAGEECLAIQPNVGEGIAAEPGESMPPATIDAIRDYLSTGGIAAQQADLCEAPRTDLQLSRTFDSTGDSR